MLKYIIFLKKGVKIMQEIFQDALLDTIKLIPFLFITYLIMEYIENKTGDKLQQKIGKTEKFGPLIGAIVRNISTMWIFCLSYKSICNKTNLNGYINCRIFINVR